MCCIPTYNLIFRFNPAIPLSIHSFFRPTVATNSYSSWDECPSNLWTLPTFSEISNMSCDDLTTPVAAAATAQVKLCPYDEEEPHTWFRLIEAQLCSGRDQITKTQIRQRTWQLPKQVLRDILDTLDVCNNSAEPFDYLKN
jgi:hypothetical protein